MERFQLLGNFDTDYKEKHINILSLSSSGGSVMLIKTLLQILLIKELMIKDLFGCVSSLKEKKHILQVKK